MFQQITYIIANIFNKIKLIVEKHNTKLIRGKGEWKNEREWDRKYFCIF